MVIQKLYDGILLKQWDLLVGSIVFRPGLMAGPVQSSGFDRVTGLAGSIFFFKKNQNDVVLVKKKTKINELQPSFWLGLAMSTGSPGQPGHTEFFLTLFFLQPGPVPASGQSGLGSTRRARLGSFRAEAHW